MFLFYLIARMLQNNIITNISNETFARTTNVRLLYVSQIMYHVSMSSLCNRTTHAEDVQ